MRKLILVLMIGMGSLATFAQTTPVKVGFADVEYIFGQMPESKQIDSQLQSLQAQLKKQYDSKVAEFQKKYDDYVKNANTVPEAVRKNSETELQQIQQNIQKLQQDSESELQKKQIALMEPVYAKVGKAIEDVAKENGYQLILSSQVSGLDVVLWGDDKINVSDLVLKKMGVTPQPADATNTPPKN